MNAVIHARLPIPVPAIPLVGGLAGLAFGLLSGSVSTKKGGLSFAMISLGLGELASSSSFILRSFFGGEEGIATNRTSSRRSSGQVWPADRGLLPHGSMVLRLHRCDLRAHPHPVRRMCNAVRDSPERSEFIGYSPRMVRLIAFCLAAFFAGVAGGLSAINFELMNAQELGAESPASCCS